MPYTIAKYLRVSAEDIDLDGFDKYESNSILNQRRLLDDFIGTIPDFAGCEVIEAVDDGLTGTNFNRPGVQELIAKAQNNQIHCIIVKDFSRFGRNHIEVGDFIEQKFPSWGIRFISLNDFYDSANFNGMTGGIDIGFRNLVYEMYSRDLSEKVCSALNAAAKNGKCVNSAAPYGYVKDAADKHKLVIDPPAADVIRRIFDLVGQQIPYARIARMLNDEGVPSPQARKRQLGHKQRWSANDTPLWTAEGISIIVKDERYTGKWIFGKRRMVNMGQQSNVRAPNSECIVVPNAIPAIVSEEKYQSVTSRLPKYEKPKNVPKQALFSRKLRCVYCGHFMTVERRKTYNQYKCRTPRVSSNHDCKKDEWVREKELEETVIALLKQQYLLSDEAHHVLETTVSKNASDIGKMESEILCLQKKIDRAKSAKLELWEKMQSDMITGDTFQREYGKTDERIDKNTAKIAELTKKIESRKSEMNQDNSALDAHNEIASLQALTREVIEEFISEIKVYSSDRIEIVLNADDVYRKCTVA